MLLKPTPVDEQTTIEIDVLASMPEALQENAPQDASNPEASKTEAAVAERKATAPSSPVQPEPLPEPVKAASASAPAQLEPLQAPFKVAVAAANVTRDPLEERAQNGNADAQYQMAIRYKDGTGVQANDETAAKWFLAAAQSHADAQYWTSVYTYHGRGTAIDRPRPMAGLDQRLYLSRPWHRHRSATCQAMAGKRCRPGPGTPEHRSSWRRHPPSGTRAIRTFQQRSQWFTQRQTRPFVAIPLEQPYNKGPYNRL